MNGSPVYSLLVPSGSSSVQDDAVAVDVNQGDRVTMRMINQTAVVDRPGGSVLYIER